MELLKGAPAPQGVKGARRVQKRGEELFIKSGRTEPQEEKEMPVQSKNTNRDVLYLSQLGLKQEKGSFCFPGEVLSLGKRRCAESEYRTGGGSLYKRVLLKVRERKKVYLENQYLPCNQGEDRRTQW